MLLVETGEEEILNLVIANQTWGAALYTNNYTPTMTDALSAYTLATGLVTDTLDLSSWGSVGISSQIGQSVYPTLTWSTTSFDQTIYGVVIYNTVSNVLIGATLFGAPFTLTSGNPLSYNLTFQEMDITLA